MLQIISKLILGSTSQMLSTISRGSFLGPRTGLSILPRMVVVNMKVGLKIYVYMLESDMKQILSTLRNEGQELRTNGILSTPLQDTCSQDFEGQEFCMNLLWPMQLRFPMS